jgi:hypothetical protein
VPATRTAPTRRAALTVSPNAYPSARACGVTLPPVRCWATVPSLAAVGDRWPALAARNIYAEGVRAFVDGLLAQNTSP